MGQTSYKYKSIGSLNKEYLILNINSDNKNSLTNEYFKFNIKSNFLSSLVNERLKLDMISDVTHFYLFLQHINTTCLLKR